MSCSRYAVFYVPPADADWARFATAWLGWDVTTGAAVAHPDCGDLPRSLSEITHRPRRYGLHGTLKPPFVLAPGRNFAGLQAAIAELAARHAPVQLDGLELKRLGRFLALRPVRPNPGLDGLAAFCVQDLDVFRAPMDPYELDRRSASGLTTVQRNNLETWGYPHVMDGFRFHLTLTERLPETVLQAVWPVLHSRLTPLLTAPVPIADIALLGEDDTGHFHLLHRYPLTGRTG